MAQSQAPSLDQLRRDARALKKAHDAGADPARRFEGCTALARAIEARGTPPPLTPEETLLARAAGGEATTGIYIDPAKLPEAYRNILRMILYLSGKMAHMERLVALGIEYDRPDAEGLTPVQVAGWEGLPEVMGYLLRLRPDLSHVNGYGGTLLSTIIHGSKNCPGRARRDYIACARMVLEHGVALPRQGIDLAGQEQVAAFLSDWAKRHPGQVV